MKIKMMMRMAALSVALLVVLAMPHTSVRAQPTEAPKPGARIERPTGRIQLPSGTVLRPLGGGPAINFGKGIDPELIKRAASLNVYKLQPPKFSHNMFDALAGRLFPGGLRGETAMAGGVMARSDAQNPSNFMMIDRGTGLLSMSRGMADLIDDQPGQLPANDEAAKLALAFLKQNDLGPRNDKEMVLARVGRVRSQSFDPRTEQKGPIRDQMLTVNFSRLVDGTEVVGNASKMIVQIGDGGKVVGVGINWRELDSPTRVGEKGLRSPDQLKKDIQSFLSQELKLASRVDILQTGLFYYDNGGNFLQPVIGYSAKVREGNVDLRYFGQTALMLNPPERVGPGPVTDVMRRAIIKGGPETQAPKQTDGE